MRNLPENLHDCLYLAEKIGAAPIRGLVLWPFLKKGSSIPFVGANVKIIAKGCLRTGRYVWVGHNVYIDADSQDGVLLGDGVTIRENATIQCRSGLNSRGVGLTIGDGTFIGPGAKIGVGGRIIFGRNCQIGGHCTFNAESHIFHQGNFTSGNVERRGITVGDNVWMGDGVTILDGVSIGSSAVLGAGAVVTRDVPPGGVFVGIPARPMKKK